MPIYFASESCISSVSINNMVYAAGNAPTNIGIGTTAQVNCSNGFDWSDGAAPRTATCSLVNGAATWSIADICVGKFLNFYI